MKVSVLLARLTREFTRAKLHYGHGAHGAREEAGWLISSVLGYLLEEDVPPRKLAKIEAIARERVATRAPLAYLLHEAWLGEHAFYVDERALVPRSFIAEMLREHLRPWIAGEPKRMLDLCTGSGCLAILMALAFPRAKVDAADLSGDALEVAKVNIRRYRLGRRVAPLKSDLFSALKRRQYDVIITNPPYVTASSMRRLPPEYHREPALGLAAGRDGLDLVRRILADAPNHLVPGGVLICEIGGNRRALERAYPRLEFAWPAVSDPGTVFAITREQLPAPPRSATRRAPRA